MNRTLVFTPGCDWKIDRHQHILFVEYKTVTGKPESKRFDLSAGTEYVVDWYKILSFDEISKPESKLQYGIQKIVYFEKECNPMVAFARGCRQNRLLIPTRIEFGTVIHVPKENPNIDSDGGKMIDQRIARIALNSTYGISSRDWGDVLADSARYIHMQRSRCNGKTLWLSSATSFADKQPLWNISRYHDICEQWLKEPPTQYDFIADDLEDCEKGVPNTKLTSVTKPMHFRGKTWTHPESSYGKKGHMLIVDINSKTFIPDDDYLDVEVGDVMWYDDGNDGKAEPDDHGKLFVWQGLGIGWKKLSDDNGYFDTDMVMTREEMQYCLNDVAVTEKIFKEEQIMRFESCKPTVKKVIFNDPATIVMWSDGTKTVVKCDNSLGDVFDPEKGVAMCCMKKLLGTNKTGSNYLDKVQEYFNSYIGESVNNVFIGEILGSIFGSKKKPSNSKDIPPEVTVEKEFEAVTSNDWTVVPADENTTAEENGE